MSLRKPNWRSEELSFEQVVEKYPTVPKLVILKTDLQLRGYVISDAARKVYEKGNFQRLEEGIFNKQTITGPRGLLLRDGTSVVGAYTANDGIRDHYVVDVADGRLVITDEGRVIEEVEFWEKTDFYDKKTKKGTPYPELITCRPQRLDFSISRICHFWDEPGGGCKYCPVGINGINACKKLGIPELYDFDEIAEAIREAVKEQGRYTMICVTGGTILSGKKVLDDEVDEYIKAFKKIKEIFNTDKLKTQVITTAFDKEQLQRLKDETGIIAYTTDIEVLNKEAFEWICPGKAKYIGYDEWKKRLYDAVDVFGRGNVNTGIVGGVELAQPNGFKSEEEALKAVLSEAEELAQHGVGVASCVWFVDGTVFKNQIPPSLDYYVALAKGFDDLRVKYDLEYYFDDYRRCGNHSSTDLARI